ncbi:MAG TPA: hypothetical protein VK688_02810 [Gemmatimonadales bacterium]|nr:hypothetical protein [Gemmatimonadales bacterium]
MPTVVRVPEGGTGGAGSPGAQSVLSGTHTGPPQHVFVSQT